MKGEISFDNLELAVALAEEGSAMYWWPDERWSVRRWSRESQQHIELMDHSSYLVRSAAAGCLGQVYWGCTDKACAEAPPPVAEIMEFIKLQERRQAGVAGPFLMGAQWGNGWEVDPSYDFRAWFLDVLRSSERERFVPHEQSLEFYAHELFDLDAAAIEEFIKMGRGGLAVLTARQSPEKIYEMLPLLEKMAASEDPKISRAIKTYLAEGRPHAGAALMGDDPWPA